MKSTTKQVKQLINDHILSYFDQDHYGSDNPDATALDNLKEQVSVFDYMPTVYAAGKYMAEGGTFLIYYTDQREFLDSLGINPDGKEYSDRKVFEQYCHLIGRQVAELVGA